MTSTSAGGRLSAVRTSRRLRRPAAVIAGVLSVGLALVACSSSTDTPATSGEGGKTVLKVYGWKGGGTELANIAEINAAFSAANPDIDLQYEFVPANDAYIQRVQPELLAGGGADVFMTDPTKVADWGQAGYLMDLSGESWVSKVEPSITSFVTYDGKNYAVPGEIIAEGMYANMDLLATVGITEVPQTFPEFKDALTKLKAAGINPIALPNKAGNTANFVFQMIAATRVYQDNPDWDQQFMDGKASFSDWKSSLDQLMSLETDGFVDYKSELGVDEWASGASDFGAGKSAFWVQGAWSTGAVQAAGLENFQFTPWPGGDAGTSPSNSLYVGSMWSVNANTKVADAAKKYTSFWAEPANALPFLEAEHAVSPWVGGTNPDDPITALTNAAYVAGNNHVLANTTWFTWDADKTLSSKLQSLQLGQIDQAQFLSDLDSQLRP
ncbi:MAG: ABC transporter substrate-binding protein [Cellulomonas sp.]